MATMTELTRASNSAIDALKEFDKNSKDITIEEAMSVGGNIEVTLSYNVDEGLSNGAQFNSNLLSLLGQRKKWRVFVIDKHTYEMKGFKAYKPKRN